MRLARITVALTGAAAGIGAALLGELAARPLHILAADRDSERLRATVAGLPPGPATITPVVCDVSRPEQIDALFAQAPAPIDLFIANAGFAYYEQIGAAEWERIERIFRVNTFAPIYSAARMRAQGAGRPHKMVITASAMAQIAVPGYALYSATKAALDRFAEAYRLETGDPRALMLVYPISTRTGFFAAAAEGTPRPWPSQPARDVARAIIRGIERDALAVYPSRLYYGLVWLDRFLPVRALIQAVELRRLRAWLAQK